MDNFTIIKQKLEVFIRRYYTNDILKGTILFFTIGLLYFLFTLFIESALWLNTGARTILFWTFVVVEVGLLTKFIAFPIAQLLKLKKGINYEDASKIIGEHFPEVNDKLLNVLQLHQADTQSELLLASINQKSLELKPIPFKFAVNYNKNIRYLKYVLIPIIIIAFIVLSGNFDWFSTSYERVVHYKTTYEPPAPFQFFVVNDSLHAIENETFKLRVRTAGEVIPETAQISFDNEVYILKKTGIGEFEYVFAQPKKNVSFQLSANKVSSKPYQLHVIAAPSLLGFEMDLDYPTYTKKKDVILKSSGNAVVPEGTKVTWRLNTKSTSTVNLYSKDTLRFSSSNLDKFEASRRLYHSFDYSLSTSNMKLKDYENLSFHIDVVKDEFPELNVKMEVDSLDLQTLYFFGQLSDDYGLNKLQMVYYPSDNQKDKIFENIPISKSNITEFVSAFPNNIDIKRGVSYSLYFQVFDNDEVNRYKSAKSPIFTYRKRTKTEEEEKQLQSQSETIKDLNKSIQKFEVQEKQLERFSKTQKEKSNLNFNDKKKLESFLKRQDLQNEMMKNFNKKLQENLEEFKKDKEDRFKEALKERVKENEAQLEKDEKLLEALKKLQDKIHKEELTQKLEDLAKQNKNKKRSLEQLLELTKRFYVEKKLDKLKEDLMKLAIDQEELSNEKEEENTKEQQDKLNERFEDFKKQIEELEKESKALRKPIEIPRDKLDEKEVEQEQQKASEALEKKESENPSDKNTSEPKDNQSSEKAKKSQKKAAKKMKQMSQQMQSAMQAGGGEQMQEDAEMLRQILDNLVLFSFDQEALMNQFESIEVNNNKYASYLRKQQHLKEYFEHIDDSLFALSLRQPKLSERVNNEVTEAFYNMDKALAQLAENQIYQGVSNQQFTITAANNLANFLSDVLDNMQETMSMAAGKGSEGDMQLPDIIMSQEELNKLMEDGMKKGQEGKPKPGEGKKEGAGKKEGDKGKDGKNGKENGGHGSESGGEGEGSNEDLNGQLYEIYQQQQQLRNALEERLAKEGKTGNGDALLKQMEEVELDLLNKGFTNQTLQKMMELKHQLLKLENATFQQGQDTKRESETNNNQFINRSTDAIPRAKQYFNTTEILNKQTLPLHQVYKKKVQAYFKKTND
ncbi:DUF4175 family protein [Changchengzhania lutea]|uniref:DUF4175 family protein n=1 Tax=Changchengzhania lutea TaxID=2049305 RepID=UPI00115DB75E|nr:DUF4175 family protein [Changchengzhania lutea]